MCEICKKEGDVNKTLASWKRKDTWQMKKGIAEGLQAVGLKGHEHALKCVSLAMVYAGNNEEFLLKLAEYAELLKKIEGCENSLN